jgi:hypothetical protein
MSATLQGADGFDLTARFRRALKEADVSPVLGWAEFTMRERTRQGRFLPGSTTKGYSTGRRRERDKKGLQTARVDLIDTGAMLDALRSQATATEDGLTLEVGYIEGQSDARMVQRARYHADPAAAAYLRDFVGLTDDEQRDAIAILGGLLLPRLTNP